MKLLAWDTSSKSGAIAAVEWDPGNEQGRLGLKLVSEWSLNVDTQHSERLLWAIDQVLRAARWKLEDVDIFGVGVGPGSFTGLRIGMTTARTLAHTIGRPLVGVSSLAALARPAAFWLAQHAPKTTLIAAADACKGELFALWGAPRAVADCSALSDGDVQGLWKRGVEEKVTAPAELIRSVRRKLGASGSSSSSWMAVGDGRSMYADAWRDLPKKGEVLPPAPFSNQVQGRYVAMLAWEAHQAGLSRDALRVHPRYLRASDAELKLKAGLLPAGPTRGESDDR